jgi:P-type Ca2+ transporter type 2C
MGIGTNRPLLAAVALTVILQLAVVYVPALNVLFKTTPLSAAELAACAASAVVILAVVEFEKWVRRRAKNENR